MGNVIDHPSMEKLAQSSAWELLHKFKEYVNQNIKSVIISNSVEDVPTMSLANTERKLEGVDPHCTAYKMIFKEITKRATQQMLGSSAMVASSLSGWIKIKHRIMSIMLKRS